MCASAILMRGGQPSITTPIAPPCDSPKVVTRNSSPNVLDIGMATLNEARQICRAFVSNAGLTQPPYNSDRLQRGLQIIDEIANVLDTNRKAHQRISYPEFLPLFFRHRSEERRVGKEC